VHWACDLHLLAWLNSTVAYSTVSYSSILYSTLYSYFKIFTSPQATEAYLVELFEDANLCAIHGKRVTISE